MREVMAKTELGLTARFPHIAKEWLLIVFPRCHNWVERTRAKEGLRTCSTPDLGLSDRLGSVLDSCLARIAA
jgi:hypothetical protein